MALRFSPWSYDPFSPTQFWSISVSLSAETASYIFESVIPTSSWDTWFCSGSATLAAGKASFCPDIVWDLVIVYDSRHVSTLCFVKVTDTIAFFFCVRVLDQCENYRRELLMCPSLGRRSREMKHVFAREKFFSLDGVILKFRKCCLTIIRRFIFPFWIFVLSTEW